LQSADTCRRRMRRSEAQKRHRNLTDGWIDRPACGHCTDPLAHWHIHTHTHTERERERERVWCRPLRLFSRRPSKRPAGPPGPRALCCAPPRPRSSPVSVERAEHLSESRVSSGGTRPLPLWIAGRYDRN
jgi:hypothetical protein